MTPSFAFTLCPTATLTNASPQAPHQAPRRHRPNNTEALKSLSIALHQWQTRTKMGSNRMPTESVLRRCSVAKELQLRSLIIRAGGHRAVQKTLNLRPPDSSRQTFQHRELQQMAHLLRDACQREHLPPPHIHFPSRNHIRRIAPSLANRIAAFPGRRGYGRLAEFINPPPLSDTVLSTSSHLPASPALSQSTTSSGIWRNTPNVFAHLANHQKHPRVLPRLCSLPSNLASAIQRQGGASVFASRHAMVLEKDWANVDRLSKLVSFLADYVDNLYHPNPDVLYLDIVSAQSTALPPFPPADIVEAAAMTQEIQRYGGKRSLALRFGFSKDHCIKGLFMGPFSVRLAADLLQYATTQVSVAKDGSVAMPSIASLRADGLGHLVAAISFFGGEEVVGRRIGLVPITPKPPFTQPSSSEITNIWMP